MLWNSYSFFVLYANIDKFKVQSSKFKVNRFDNLLDRWIISELNVLVKEINTAMENYELNKACRLFPKFIDNLSNWYIRRSRKRFWKSENDEDKNQAYQTLYTVLTELSKLMAPFTPFIAEEIYRNLVSPTPPQSSPRAGEEVKIKSPSPLQGEGWGEVASVHLTDFPTADEKLIDEKLNQEMNKIREIVSAGLQLRADAGIKVRQPLSQLQITNYKLRDDLINIAREEVNVKEIKLIKGENFNIELNTEISEELKLEGIAREIIRHIQEMRKEAGYEVDNRIKVCYIGLSEVFDKFSDMIAKEVLADKLKEGEIENFDIENEFNIEGKVKIQIKK